jgi:hypothetical protein
MTLLRLATRTACRGGQLVASNRTTIPAVNTVSLRWYLAPSVKVSHYECGWNADEVDDNVKNIKKYCTQTYNKISQVVSFFETKKYNAGS